METLFIIALAALPVWVALYGVYLGFVRPGLHAKYRYHFTTIENAAIIELISATTPARISALKTIRVRCRRARNAIDKLSIGSILLQDVAPKTDAEIKAERLIMDAAPLDLRQQNERVTALLFFTVLANSPTFSLLGIGLFGLSVVFGAAKSLVARVTDQAWDFAAAQAPAC